MSVMYPSSISLSDPDELLMLLDDYLSEYTGDKRELLNTIAEWLNEQ